MAANSLLLFLLTTGLTTPPDESVTTESNFGLNTIYTEEDAARWYGQTRWPDHGQGPEDISVRWRQEPRYTTENPYGQFPDTPVTEESDDKTYRPYDWPRVTEEPEEERERTTLIPLATEEPESETEQSEMRQKRGSFACPQNEHYKRCGSPCPQTCFETPPCPSNCCLEGCFCNKDLVRSPFGNCIKPEDCPLDTKDEKDKCPPREHFTKCHKNCEKTCANYNKRHPCPKSCKKGCVCDGGLVRNREGKCVPRDQCPKKMMADEDDSHGCPYEYTCDVYCVTQGKISGFCEGNVCKCRGKERD
ncbi:Venom serine protease inhibitor like protein [Argiope bruennichi]|uniref:Venom serine protease inhibitor like protein n=1 Tax=Argiope bruennichi TaxID=94029 RepID=A0A8T0EGR0_ARGBR|nr:Venom serine protease inhibitor like protein [Argiope bruennichi]